MEDKVYTGPYTATFSGFGGAKMILSTGSSIINVRAVVYNYYPEDPNRIENGKILFEDMDLTVYALDSDNEIHIMFVNEFGEPHIRTLKGVRVTPDRESNDITYGLHNFTARSIHEH